MTTVPLAEQNLARHRSMKLVDKHVGLDPDEEVILLVRQHWVLFRNSLLLALFVPFVLFFGIFVLKVYPLGWSPQTINLLVTVLLGLSGIAFVAGAIGFLWKFHMWQHTFYVMTSKKLAIINRYKPWNYEVQQMSLANINDVTLRQEGLEAMMYGYSDVIAVTFSGSTFVFERVGHASRVQKAIMQQLALQPRSELSAH